MMQRRRLPDSSVVFDLHRPHLSVPERIPEHREGLRQAIAQLTEEAARAEPPSPPSRVVQALMGIRSPAVCEKDRILCEAWDALTSDQRAALAVAAGLSLQQLPRESPLWPEILGHLLLSLLLVGCMVTGYGGVWIAFPAAAYLLWSLWKQYLRSYTELPFVKHMEAADLKVALAMDHPGRYLEALEKLEAAELAGWEVLRGEVEMKRPYSHRRERLCARLGFTRSAGSGLPLGPRNARAGCPQAPNPSGIALATQRDIDRAVEAGMAEE